MPSDGIETATAEPRLQNEILLNQHNQHRPDNAHDEHLTIGNEIAHAPLDLPLAAC